MRIGIDRFCPGKMGFKPLGLGFGHWEWEKIFKNKKWEWDLRIAKWDLEKKNELGNGIGIPLQEPLCKNMVDLIK